MENLNKIVCRRSESKLQSFNEGYPIYWFNSGTYLIWLIVSSIFKPDFSPPEKWKWKDDPIIVITGDSLIHRFTTNGLKFKDGRELEAIYVVLFCTGSVWRCVLFFILFSFQYRDLRNNSESFDGSNSGLCSLLFFFQTLVGRRRRLWETIEYNATRHFLTQRNGAYVAAPYETSIFVEAWTDVSAIHHLVTS